jgi:hypothetical protein
MGPSLVGVAKALAIAAEVSAANAREQVSSLQAIAKTAELTAQATESNRLMIMDEQRLGSVSLFLPMPRKR